MSILIILFAVINPFRIKSFKILHIFWHRTAIKTKHKAKIFLYKTVYSRLKFTDLKNDYVLTLRKYAPVNYTLNVLRSICWNSSIHGHKRRS